MTIVNSTSRRGSAFPIWPTIICVAILAALAVFFRYDVRPIPPGGYVRLDRWTGVSEYCATGGACGPTAAAAPRHP